MNDFRGYSKALDDEHLKVIRNDITGPLADELEKMPDVFEAKMVRGADGKWRTELVDPQRLSSADEFVSNMTSAQMKAGLSKRQTRVAFEQLPESAQTDIYTTMKDFYDRQMINGYGTPTDAYPFNSMENFAKLYNAAVGQGFANGGPLNLTAQNASGVSPRVEAIVEKYGLDNIRNHFEGARIGAASGSRFYDIGGPIDAYNAWYPSADTQRLADAADVSLWKQDNQSVADAVAALRSGEDLKALQGKLFDLGYYVDSPSSITRESATDGMIGPVTRKAAQMYFQDVEDGKYSPVNTGQYTKVLRKPVEPSFIQTLIDTAADGVNYFKWKNTVDKVRETTTEEVPTVDMGWHVTDDQLTRFVSLLPDNLSPQSNRSWANPSAGSYANTWDSDEYVKDNHSNVAEWLKRRGNKEGKLNTYLSLAGTSLAQPGRATLGSVLYRTTPQGIELSDGYEFAAAPDAVRLQDSHTGSYNSTRKRISKTHRAKNNTHQTYFIPWQVYNQIHNKD